MTKIGERKTAKEIGLSSNCPVIWLPCPDCGKERWVFLYRGKPTSVRCNKCRGEHQTAERTKDLQAETKKDWELGKPSNGQTFIKRACVACGKESWVLLRNGEPISKRCRPCGCKARAEAQVKKRVGRRSKTSEGYIKIFLDKNDFFYSMTNIRSQVMEHRLVMAKHLGRCLHRWEIVHHKGTKYPKGRKENKSDNRIENLQLVTDERHQQITIMDNRIQHLEKRVTLLEAENTLLKGLEVR